MRNMEKVKIYIGKIKLNEEVFMRIKLQLSNYDFYEVDGSFVWYSKDAYSRLQLYRDGRFEVRKGLSLIELNHKRTDIGSVDYQELIDLVKEI